LKQSKDGQKVGGCHLNVTLTLIILGFTGKAWIKWQPVRLSNS